MVKLGALAAVCAAAVVATGTGSAITTPRVIRVLEVGSVDVNLDSQSEPRSGDRFYFANLLYSWAGSKRGKRIGRDEGLCTFTVVDFSHGRASAFCTAQFFLPGGSLATQAFLRFEEGPTAFDVPVTGGTGAYENAAGSIHIRDLGDSGNSALTFHLSP